MQRSGAAIIALFLGMALSPRLDALDKIPIAIMDFKVTNIQKSEFDLFVDFFNNALFETGVFDVLQRNKREQLMKEIEFSLSDAADARRTRQIGKLLSSTLLVFGNLGKVGRNILLSVSIVDVETGLTASVLSRTYANLEAVFGDLQGIASSLAESAEQSQFQRKANILYFENFDDKRWNEYDNMFYRDGTYHVRAVDTPLMTWQTQTYDDFIMEAAAGRVEGDNKLGFGLVYRLQDANNFYVFLMADNGFYSVQKCVNGNYTNIVAWNKATAVKAGEMNSMKVSAFRSRFVVYINNVKLREFSDNTFSKGYFGIFSSHGVHAAFDNLILYQGNLVYYERFERTASIFAEADVAYSKDGIYHVDGKSADGTYYSWILESMKNTSFKAEVSWLAGKTDIGYGLAFRLRDALNNYTFVITKSGSYSLIKYLDSQPTYLIPYRKTRSLNPDGKNIMRVECVGDTFTLFINENLVETVVDDTFAAGKLGFMSYRGVDAVFDNAEIFSLE